MTSSRTKERSCVVWDGLGWGGESGSGRDTGPEEGRTNLVLSLGAAAGLHLQGARGPDQVVLEEELVHELDHAR
jgi:hypothetical protein